MHSFGLLIALWSCASAFRHRPRMNIEGRVLHQHHDRDSDLLSENETSSGCKLECHDMGIREDYDCVFPLIKGLPEQINLHTLLIAKQIDKAFFLQTGGSNAAEKDARNWGSLQGLARQVVLVKRQVSLKKCGESTTERCLHVKRQAALDPDTETEVYLKECFRSHLSSLSRLRWVTKERWAKTVGDIQNNTTPRALALEALPEDYADTVMTYATIAEELAQKVIEDISQNFELLKDEGISFTANEFKNCQKCCAV